MIACFRKLERNATNQRPRQERIHSRLASASITRKASDEEHDLVAPTPALREFRRRVAVEVARKHVSFLENFMSIKWILKVVALVGVVGTANIIGCGSDTGSSSTGNSSSSTFTGSCCLNGSFYSCPDEGSVSKCSLDAGPGACTRDSSRDTTCK